MPLVPIDPIKALDLLDWIPLKRYLELTQETRPAIKKRIKTRAWMRGREFTTPHGADMWVSLSAVRAWAARDSTLHPSKPAEPPELPP